MPEGPRGYTPSEFETEPGSNPQERSESLSESEFGAKPESNPEELSEFSSESESSSKPEPEPEPESDSSSQERSDEYFSRPETIRTVNNEKEKFALLVFLIELISKFKNKFKELYNRLVRMLFSSSKK